MPTADSVARWQAFHLVKAGNAPTEYEDAFAANPVRGRFAVADGASEASFAAAWARFLVEGFLACRTPWRDFDWLAPVRKRWAAEVDTLPLPWYAEAKREQGAFATFLGLGVRASGPGQLGMWRAVAVGDSCLFRIRADRMLSAFPLTVAADFGNQPRLLGSRPGSAAGVAGRHKLSGRWRPGDRFLLMTDALAQWFLHQIESATIPMAEIAALLAEADPQAAFPGWVEERRAHGMRNDDVTLLVIDL